MRKRFKESHSYAYLEKKVIALETAIIWNATCSLNKVTTRLTSSLGTKLSNLFKMWHHFILEWLCGVLRVFISPTSGLCGKVWWAFRLSYNLENQSLHRTRSSPTTSIKQKEWPNIALYFGATSLGKRYIKSPNLVFALRIPLWRCCGNQWLCIRI